MYQIDRYLKILLATTQKTAAATTTVNNSEKKVDWCGRAVQSGALKKVKFCFSCFFSSCVKKADCSSPEFVKSA